MKRVHPTLPIYSKLGYIPECGVYALAETKSGPYSYIGTSTNFEKRYKKYQGFAFRSNWQSHESQIKLNWFKDHFVEGVSPYMIILAEAENQSHASQLEKEYRTKYTNKSHPLLNKTGKQPVYLKNNIKRAANDGIDNFFEGGWLKALAFIALVTLSGYILTRTRTYRDEEGSNVNGDI